MRASIQILFSAASFCAVYLIGLVFGVEFWQAGIHFEETLDGKPLPKITEVFVSNSWLASLLFSLPWFVLLGLPLLAPAEGDGFRSRESFVLRYLAFLSVELFLAFILVQALVMPYFSYYAVLTSPEESTAELIPAVVLGLAGVILTAAIVRGWMGRRKSGAGRNDGT